MYNSIFNNLNFCSKNRASHAMLYDTNAKKCIISSFSAWDELTEHLESININMDSISPYDFEESVKALENYGLNAELSGATCFYFWID